MEDLKLKYKNTTVISGIGCTGRSAGYFNLDTVHTTHGRALPVAEGIKIANPKMNVIVISGDGDLLSIGGNHLIHTSRRNTNITAICYVNEIYALTGGQVAPTTKRGIKTITTPQGNPYMQIKSQSIITSYPNHFFAKTSICHQKHLRSCIKRGIKHKGFAFIEIRGFCIESDGRRRGYKNATEMMEKIKKKFKIRKRTGSTPLKDNELGIVETLQRKVSTS